MAQVVLAVPHGYCPPATVRICDRVAERSARALSGALSWLGVDAHVHVLSTLRADVDMNRWEARGTLYRLKLLVDMKAAALLLDVHSFPPERPDRGELYVLYLVGGTQERLAVDFQEYMLRTIGLTVPIVRGKASTLLGGGNDILTVARTIGLPALLLEFREDLGDGRLAELAAPIARWTQSKIV